MQRIYRYNGQVTDRIDTYEDATYLSSDEHAAGEVAEALGVDVSTITVEHVQSAPAIEVTIPPAEELVAVSAKEQTLASVRAINIDVIQDEATRNVVRALRDAVLGEPQAEEFSVVETEGVR